MKRGIDCWVHIHHDNVPLEDHHILPKEFGGPSIPANLVRICSNAHSDVHYYIALLLKFEDRVPWNIERTFGNKTRQLAQRGYNEMRKEFMPGKIKLIRSVLLDRHELTGSVEITVVHANGEEEKVQ